MYWCTRTLSGCLICSAAPQATSTGATHYGCCRPNRVPRCRDERGRRAAGNWRRPRRPMDGHRGPLGTISWATESRRSPPPAAGFSGLFAMAERRSGPHTTAMSPAPGFTWAWKSVGGWVGLSGFPLILGTFRCPRPPSPPSTGRVSSLGWVGGLGANCQRCPWAEAHYEARGDAGERGSSLGSSS